MKQLLTRHYQAIRNRGLIDENTDTDDFLRKLEEEFIELCTEQERDLFVNEAIDCMCVITNMLTHMGVDIEKELLKNVLTQEKRANENRTN